MSDMGVITRPMLAATVEVDTFDKIKWPVFASPKIDGIRCLIHPTLGPVSRTFKPIANVYVREFLDEYCRGAHVDGELYAINEDGTANFNATQSAIMSRGGRPRFHYSIFDCFDRPDDPFEMRHARALAKANLMLLSTLSISGLEHVILRNAGDLVEYSDECLARGYEGIVIRAQGGAYKSGRSTLNQGGMLKYKPWADAEGIIIGFEELMHNDNYQENDAFGLAKRSSHLEGKTPAGTLGALVLQTAWGVLRVGTGFDAATRQAIWDRNQGFRPGDEMILNRSLGERCTDIGRKVTFKYQKHGMQDLPRFPVFKGFRED